MADVDLEHLKAEFTKRFAAEPEVFRAPGRVNLIGEHTDYNDGFVMPAAIGFATYAACAPNRGDQIVIASLQEQREAAFPLREPYPEPRQDWTDYVRGVQVEVDGVCQTVGTNLLVDGHVPIGAGLSSSAAIEVATACALLSLSACTLPPADIALLCQRAENVFVGARCGIMDQFASVHGRADHAMLLDCRSLNVRYVPVPHNIRLIICNTMVKHSIAGGEYNTRRAECEECVRYFARFRPGIRALRDVTESDLAEHAQGLNDVLLRRARHVITEDDRVLRAAEALQSGDLKLLGDLMYESHRSLRDDYEVSCPELDIMVEAARTVPGTYGARMTGGGFGGCTINLVDENAVGGFKTQVAATYQKKTGIEPEVYVTEAAQGADRVA